MFAKMSVCKLSILFGAILSISCSVSESGDSVRSTYFHEEIDFGEIKAGQVLKHTIRIKNESKVKISVISSSSSCACTIVQADGIEIPALGFVGCSDHCPDKREKRAFI